MSEEKQEKTQEEPRIDRASKLMNGMMKGLREFGSSAMEKAEEFGKIASEKAEEYTKLGKIKLDIHQLRRSRTKALSELGELVMSLNTKPKLAKLAEHEEYIRLKSEISTLETELKRKEDTAKKVAEEEEISLEDIGDKKE